MLLFPKTLSHRALWRLVAAPGQYYHWLLETIVKNFIGLENEVHGAGTVYRRGGVGLARKAAAASAGAEIGRASCRERVEVGEVGGGGMKREQRVGEDGGR